MLEQILTSNGMATDHAERSRFSCPGVLYFLQEDYIRTYGGQYALIPTEHLDELVALAARIQSSPDLKLLAWHCYGEYCLTPARFYKNFPPTLDVFGDDDSRLFFVLLLLANVRIIEQRAEREGFPVKYAHDYAARISTMSQGTANCLGGHWGVVGTGMAFVLGFRDGAMFRIGRFDFCPLQVKYSLAPMLYTDGKDVIGLCNDGQAVRDNDELAPDAEHTARKTRLVITDKTVTGTPVNFTRGLVEHREVTLDLDKWHAIAGPEDWTVDFHIPGGGGMTPEKAQASFVEAWQFFKSYFPDRDFKFIWSNSWIFSPDWLDYIPESNMAKLIRRGRIYPVVSTGKDGLGHIFMRSDDAYDEYKVRTSLQATVLRCLKERGFLRRCGWFILPEEI